MSNKHRVDTMPELPQVGGVLMPGLVSTRRRESFWQARLLLSTLDPHGWQAAQLRQLIREGRREEVQVLLDEIYAEREKRAEPEPSCPGIVSSRPASRSSTLLPPSSSEQRRSAMSRPR